MRSRLLLLTLVGPLVACSGSPATPSTATTTTAVTVKGTAALATSNPTSQLTATATLSTGATQDVTASAVWQSSATSVATVSTAGLVTGLGTGTTTITATYQGKSGTLVVTSAVIIISSVAVSGTATLNNASPISQLTATATLANGTTQAVTAGAVWQSSNPAVVTVSSTGLITAAAAGMATITAAYLDKSGSLAVSNSVTATTITISSCGTLAAPGRYVLNADMSGSGSAGACIFITASGVDLECNGHSVSGTTGPGISVSGTPLNLVQNVFVSNCTVPTVAHPGSLTTFAGINVALGMNVQILGNRTTEVDIQAGQSNTIASNQIDGLWMGSGQQGADDGILALNESGDVIQGNVIQNVWDACVETVGTATNLMVTNNSCSNAGQDGFGAYYATSWMGNSVDNNSVDRSPTFARILWNTATGYRGGTIFLQNNIFDSNRFTNQTSQVPVITIDMSAMLPSPLVSGGNVLRNNNFGTVGIAPVLLPASAFSDGGGNIWPGHTETYLQERPSRSVERLFRATSWSVGALLLARSFREGAWDQDWRPSRTAGDPQDASDQRKR